MRIVVPLLLYRRYLLLSLLPVGQIVLPPEVLDALRAWRDERTLLSDSLDEDMLSKLKSGLAMSESGMLTVNIEAPDEEKRPFSRLVFSFPAFKIAGPDKQLIEYLEWNFY